MHSDFQVGSQHRSYCLLKGCHQSAQFSSSPTTLGQAWLHKALKVGLECSRCSGVWKPVLQGLVSERLPQSGEVGKESTVSNSKLDVVKKSNGILFWSQV